MTKDDVPSVLADLLPSFEVTGEPTTLTGGLLNHVWRVQGRTGSVVLKYTPPHMASNPTVAMDPDRSLFEAQALRMLGPEGRWAHLSTEACRAPHLEVHDPERKVLVMEDVGPGDHLGVALVTNSLQGVAQNLGSYLGRLHRETLHHPCLSRFDNRPIQETRRVVQYQATGPLLQKYSVSGGQALGKRMKAFGERLLEPGICLIQGDLWLPSLLVRNQQLRVIDWEFCHAGIPAQDLGHLAAHLWMHRCAYPKGQFLLFLSDVLDAYHEAVGPVGEQLFARDGYEAIALHFGAEVLVRTIGPFRDRYLFASEDPASETMRRILRVAVDHIRHPEESAIVRMIRDELRADKVRRYHENW